MNTYRTPPHGITIAKSDPLLVETLRESLQHRHFFVHQIHTDGLSVLSALKRGDLPDLLVLGAELGNTTGIEIAQYVSDQKLPIECVIFSRSRFLNQAQRAVELGVKGYLYVQTGFAELYYCIQEVLAGRSYISPLANDDDHVEQSVTSSVPPDQIHVYLKKLSKREKELLDPIAAGMNNQQIGEKLYISPFTVNNHRHNMIKKLGFKGANQLLLFALSVQKMGAKN